MLEHTSPDAPAALTAWVAGYVAEASRDDNVEGFVAQVNAAILAETPDLAADPVLVGELHASTKAQFQVFLSLLERPEQELLLPPQAVDLALSIARRQLELGVLLTVYRVAHGAVWRFFTEVIEDLPDGGPDRTEVLIYLWDHAGTWINGAIERLIQVYDVERGATLEGALARRTETVHALLRGDTISADTATRELGYPVRGCQTAVVVWSDDEVPVETLLPLQALAAVVAEAVGARATLTVPVGRREVWCWCATAGHPDLDAMRDAVATHAGSPALHVAIGTPAVGLAGFRQSHREAVEAERFAVSAGSVDPVIAYADVELACLVAGNEPGVRALIARELGALAHGDKGLGRVRETLATYLSLGGNVEAAASSLIVHKNTVRYRLARAEELVGHPLTERRTEMALALGCLERYGASETR